MQARSSLCEELDRIRRELTLMAARVEDDLGKALAVLQSGSRELADEVKASGKMVDALQLEIEDMVLACIATQQPVARDLRELVTVFKIAANLERIGDFGIHLAKTAIKLSDRPPFRFMERIERMAETGQQMLRMAIFAYLAQDADAARKAAVLDDIIDREHKALTEEALALIKLKPELVKPAARLLRLSGYMERLGDHVTTICESIIYMTDSSHEELG